MCPWFSTFRRPNAANQRAAQTAIATRLDSTQDIPPRICRLPAHVVEARITVAGNICHNESLALAVRCIGLVIWNFYNLLAFRLYRNWFPMLVSIQNQNFFLTTISFLQFVNNFYHSLKRNIWLCLLVYRSCDVNIFVRYKKSHWSCRTTMTNHIGNGLKRW